jgi:hypothetical protein
MQKFEKRTTRFSRYFGTLPYKRFVTSQIDQLQISQFYFRLETSILL